MALWFSGSAVVPALDREWNLTDEQVSWISIAVQLGFVAEPYSARLSTSRHHHHSPSLRSLSTSRRSANAIFGLYVNDPNTAIVLRFLTASVSPRVYPPGMKIMATWFRERRGMALGSWSAR
jgi:MFS family permease